MSDFIQLLKDNISDCELLFDEPLSEHSSFHIGGNADAFARPDSEEKFISLISFLRKNAIPYVVIGAASNILFSDKGYRGVVITTLGLKDISFGENSVTVGAGVTMPILSSKAQRLAYDGLRFMCGIPGTLGGGVFMNAGAYGGEIGCVLISSKYYDALRCEIGILEASEHEFSYRHSSYMEHPERIILSATLAVKKGDADEIKAECDELLRRRAEKQPLEYPSAGSTFKRYPGFFTAQLIDECGLKGVSVGGAAVSEKHAGFVINKGGATSADVLELIEKIKGIIKSEKGIEIECEVRFIGER